MPRSREQIKHDPVAADTWRPQRTQVGGLWFNPLKIKPMGDHILVVLDVDHPFSESPIIVKPQIAEKDIGTRTGTVIAVGPGKWSEKRNYEESFMLNPLIFRPTQLKPGDRVTIGHYSDWESHFCDYEGRGANVVLCQEADVRLFERPHTA